jgi:hypothetical protein
MQYICVCESVTVKSILLDIKDNDKNFHGGKGTLRVVLYDRLQLWEILCCEGAEYN